MPFWGVSVLFLYAVGSQVRLVRKQGTWDNLYFRRYLWKLLQLAAHKPCWPWRHRTISAPPRFIACHSTKHRTARTNDLMHSVVAFPSSQCSFMSKPTTMLTTIPTSAWFWHQTGELQIEHSCCLWCRNTSEVSLTAPGLTIKERVSLSSSVAEILHQVYSFPSVKCTSFTQNIAQLLVSTCPPKQSKTTDRTKQWPQRAECDGEIRWVGVFQASPLLLPGKESSVSASSRVFVVQNQNHDSGEALKGAKSSCVDLPLKRLRLSGSGRGRGKKRERQELVQGESGRF